MLPPNILTNTLDKDSFFAVKHGIYITFTDPRLFIQVLRR